MGAVSGVAERCQAAENFQVLLEWAAGAIREELPEPVWRRAALILADDLGAIVCGHREPEVMSAISGMQLHLNRTEATVFAAGAPRFDRYGAATANGLAAAWCELDEGYRPAPCHAGIYTLPAILSEVESADRSVADLLRLLAVAYEVTARVARAFSFPVGVVHPHAAFAPVGAAAGAALARGMTSEPLCAAVTGAASLSFAGPFGLGPEGALIRNAWTAAGAWIGLQAVDWALAGIGGKAETPYDVFAGVLGADVAPGELTAGLGETWAVLDGYHKIFACCQYAHPALEANLELHARLAAAGRTHADITTIGVETHPRGMALVTVEPATVLAAKFSLPHAIAASTVFGTGGQAAFTRQALCDDHVASLRRKVVLTPHPAVGEPPFDRPARVTWHFTDGETWIAACDSARGGSDRPFDEATILGKLAETTGATFPRMAAILKGIVEGEPLALTAPWHSAVDTMTGR